MLQAADQLTKSAEILANEFNIDIKDIVLGAEHRPALTEENASFRSPTRIRPNHTRRSHSGSAQPSRGVAFAVDQANGTDNRPALSRRRTSFTNGSRVASVSELSVSTAETIPEVSVDDGTPRMNGSSIQI